MLRLIASILVLASRAVASSDRIQAVKEINFVITTSKFKECLFALTPNATLMDLRTEIILHCGFQYPFRIQILGETVAPLRVSHKETIAENRFINSIWSMLVDSWNGTVAFRIPLKIRAPPDEDTAVYFSLLKMLSTLQSNDHHHLWFQFIRKCSQSKSCSVQDLCDQFERHFQCHYGELKWIVLSKQTLEGKLDLFFLPSTVTKLNVGDNSLTEICGLDQLSAKQLVTLKVVKNPLEIDLQPLVLSNSSRNNPLKCLGVSANQIKRSLCVGATTERVEGDDNNFGRRLRRAATKWINSSILDRIVIGWKGQTQQKYHIHHPQASIESTKCQPYDCL